MDYILSVEMAKTITHCIVFTLAYANTAVFALVQISCTIQGTPVYPRFDMFFGFVYGIIWSIGAFLASANTIQAGYCGAVAAAVLFWKDVIIIAIHTGALEI